MRKYRYLKFRGKMIITNAILEPPKKNNANLGNKKINKANLGPTRVIRLQGTVGNRGHYCLGFVTLYTVAEVSWSRVISLCTNFVFFGAL